MLADAVVFCRHLGLTALSITCADGNIASPLVIEYNGGVLEGVVAGERRYRLMS